MRGRGAARIGQPRGTQARTSGSRGVGIRVLCWRKPPVWLFPADVGLWRGRMRGRKGVLEIGPPWFRLEWKCPLGRMLGRIARRRGTGGHGPAPRLKRLEGRASEEVRPECAYSRLTSMQLHARVC